MIYGRAPSVFLFLQQFSFVVWKIPFTEYQKQVYDNTQACTFPLVEKENSKINTRTQVLRSLLSLRLAAKISTENQGDRSRERPASRHQQTVMGPGGPKPAGQRKRL